MKRSTIIVISVIILSIVLGGLLGFYFYLNSKAAREATIGTRVETGSGSFGTPGVDMSVTLPGNASTTQPAQTPEISSTTEPVLPPIPALRKIYADPVSGSAFFPKDVYATTSAVTETIFVANGTTTASSTKIIKAAQTRLTGRIEVMRFTERSSGHIYEASSTSLVIQKVSNTTVPKVYESLFVGPESVIYRGLYGTADKIQTQYGVQRLLIPTSTEKTLVTTELPAEIQQLSISPSKNKVFFMQNKSPLGVIANPDGTSAVSVFDSPYKEWLISWPNERLLTLTTKPTAFTEGYMYSVNVATKALQKIMGGKRGLVTLMSPDANKVLYTESISGSSYLSVYDVQTKSSRALFFRTIVDKCVWSQKDKDIAFCAIPQDIASGDYPDAWYQGLIFFTDEIWKINTLTGETQLITILSDLTTDSIDATNLTVNPTDTFMTFNNKADLSLWGLRLVKDEVKTATSTQPVATTTIR